MWLVIKLQMYTPPSSFFFFSLFRPQPRPHHPRNKPAKGGREGEDWRNRKTTKNKNKECWRGSQYWETDLIACVWKAKEKRDKLATGSQWEKKKKMELLWAPADCRAISSQWRPLVVPGGHVGPSVSGMWDEEHKQRTTVPLQSSLRDGLIMLVWRRPESSEAAILRPQLSTFPSHHQGRLA